MSLELKKPNYLSKLEEKEIFIQNKYIKKKFIERKSGSTKIDTVLWNSVFRKNIRNVYGALIRGADINSMHTTNAASNLVHQMDSKIFGQNNHDNINTKKQESKI